MPGLFHRGSAWTLIAVNLLPVYGVLAWGWSVFDIVFLYWVENLVIGAINVLRMAVSVPGVNAPAGAGPLAGQRYLLPSAARWGVLLFLVPFFIIHYGAFCYGHGLFIFVLLGDGAELGWHSFLDVFTPVMALATAGLAASHLYSFFTNYIGRGEYRRADVRTLMGRPYGRIVAMHVAILAGGFGIALLGSPLPLLLVLIAGKTAMDLGLHQRERRKLGPAVHGPSTGPAEKV